MIIEDIVQAAFLQTRGHTLLELKAHPHKPGRVLFVFEDRPDIAGDAQDFLEDGEVPARTLARRIGRLRDRIRIFRGEREPMERSTHAKAPSTSR